MNAPTPPSRESLRMDAVHRYDVLDTSADGNFDRITALAAHPLQVPISIVSIVDTDACGSSPVMVGSRFDGAVVGAEAAESVAREAGVRVERLDEFDARHVSDADAHRRVGARG